MSPAVNVTGQLLTLAHFVSSNGNTSMLLNVDIFRKPVRPSRNFCLISCNEHGLMNNEEEERERTNLCWRTHKFVIRPQMPCSRPAVPSAAPAHSQCHTRV